MPWNRPPRRTESRRLRPRLEVVEARCLLSAWPGVEGPGAVEPAKTSTTPATTTSTPYDLLIGASVVRSTYGVSGAGMTAAVIDTGIEYKHPALGGGYGPGKVVRDGYDFGEQDNDPMSTGWPHGTAVAGLIASRDAIRPGVAPGADIAALRVFGDDGRGSFDWIADALKWVLDNRQRLNITVVNLSLSDGRNYLPGQLSESPVIERIRSLVDQLAAVRIPVVSAAGNSFQGQQGMGFTAILPGTISVSGTDRNDRIVADAQRLGRGAGGDAATDLVAPGTDLSAPGPKGSFTNVTGTSFAAPLVSGSILLLQQIYRNRFGELPTVDQLAGWLRGGAETISDPATGATFGRLDVAASAALIPQRAVAPPSAPAVPTGGGSSSGAGKTSTPTKPSGGTVLPPSSAPGASSSVPAPPSKPIGSVPSALLPPSSPAGPGSQGKSPRQPRSAAPSSPPSAEPPRSGTTTSQSASKSSQGSTSKGSTPSGSAPATTSSAAPSGPATEEKDKGVSTGAAGSRSRADGGNGSSPAGPAEGADQRPVAARPTAIGPTPAADDLPVASSLGSNAVESGSAAPPSQPASTLVVGWNPPLLDDGIGGSESPGQRVEVRELEARLGKEEPAMLPSPPVFDVKTPAGRRAMLLARLQAVRAQREALRTSPARIRLRIAQGLPVGSAFPTGPRAWWTRLAE